MGKREKLESKFQKELVDEIKRTYPGCIVIKNDANYIQGFPDWTVMYRDKYAVLETKKEEDASHQPNQDGYVERLDAMSFSRFVSPENKTEVLHDLSEYFLRGRRRI